MDYKKEKKFDEKFSKKYRNESNLKVGIKKKSNRVRFNENVSEIVSKSYDTDESYNSKRKTESSSKTSSTSSIRALSSASIRKPSSSISSRKEVLNRYVEDGKLNVKYLHKRDSAGKRGKPNDVSTKDSSSTSRESKIQIENINQEIRNQAGSSDVANVWMVRTCGPERCSMEPDDLISKVTEPEDLQKLEEYNNTSFPFPVKNKYLEILKVHDFPFDEIGPFEETKKKEKKCSFKPPVAMVQKAIDEANELFTKAGYEDELIEWITRVFNIYPRPEDPHEYLKYNSGGGQDQKSYHEYLQYLDELKNLLAFENELAFELAQIKLLCGMVDEEMFGYDGKPRDEWNNQISTMRKKKTLSKIKCLSILYTNVNKEIKMEKQNIAQNKAAAKQAIRDQIMRDLPIWKAYLAPIPVITKYEEDDGRIRDWFKCLRFPEEGESQAPVHEFDDIEAFQMETFDELKSRSSSLLEEDFK